MKNLSSNLYKEVCIYACLFLAFTACRWAEEKNNVQPTATTENSVSQYFNNQLDSIVFSLHEMAGHTDKDSLLNNYLTARKHFKRSEPILAFADRENYLSLNQPNILKVMEEDATDIKILPPFGFQVIEELLLEDSLSLNMLKSQAKKTLQRIKLVQSTKKIDLKNHHLIWLMRDQIIRIASLGITGFDSPMGNSLQDSRESYFTLKELFKLNEKKFNDKNLAEQWKREINNAILELNTDFNSFDRYSFIKENIQNQLKLLVKTQEDWNVEFPFELAIDNSVTGLFTDSTFNQNFFNDFHLSDKYTLDKAKLGKRLFHDLSLSKSKQMSCATCHQKKKAFTDGKIKFIHQKRNTPTLAYAALQTEFFYDNRAGSLEGQIVSVVNNKHEFESDMISFVKKILADTAYLEEFNRNYEGNINDRNVRNALASYVRSLSPFNSRFDKNMSGVSNDLTVQEKKGFNLFMGKAQCATCHFAPTFNGTVPPYFTTTEMELLGVPKNKKGTEVDNDFGRYEIFKTEERKYFFKTPTIRNVELTAPYMHNGVYTNLKEVIEFYNNGGGAGMGFDLPYQTLPSDSLDLNSEEIDAIVAFMESLTDQVYKQ